MDMKKVDPDWPLVEAYWCGKLSDDDFLVAIEQRHGVDLKTAVRSILEQYPSVVDDVLQVVRLKFLTSIKSRNFKGKCAVRSWLIYVIGRNEALRERQRQTRLAEKEPSILDDLEVGAPNEMLSDGSQAAMQIDFIIRQGAVREALKTTNRITDDEKWLIEAHYLEEKSFQEIAELLKEKPIRKIAELLIEAHYLEEKSTQEIAELLKKKSTQEIVELLKEKSLQEIAKLEIAELKRSTAPSVRGRIHRALVKLRRDQIFRILFGEIGN